MSLLDANRSTGITWTSVGKCYEVTKKRRSADVKSVPQIPFAAMEAIPQGGAYDPVYELKEAQSIASGTYFEKGDVLVAKITPSFENGKQAWARSLPLPFGYASTEVIPFRPRCVGNDPRLLFFYLLHPDIRSYVAERMEGSTGRQRVPEQVILELPFPAFVQDEQSVIADSLELIQSAIAHEVAAYECATQLKQATMRQLFTRGLRGEAQKETEIGLIPESWDAVQLGHVCTLSTGTTPATKNKDYYEGEIPFLKTADVTNNRITSAKTFLSQQAVDDYSLRLFPPGTILMAMYGQGKTRGQVALLEIAATTTQNAGAIQPSSEMDSAFLWHYLRSCYERLRGMGSLGHVSHLNLGYLRDLLVVKPSLNEQSEISVILDALDRKITLHQRKQSVLEELFRSLLHKLLTGEISVLDIDLPALTDKESEPQTEAEVQS